MNIRRTRRHGYTLLEMLAATAIAGGILTASLVALEQGMEHSRTAEVHNLLTTLAVSKTEEQMGIVAHTFSTSDSTGDFRAIGKPSLGYRVTCSDSVSSGGRPGELMAIKVIVWSDSRANGAYDIGEQEVTMHTTIAKLKMLQN